MDFYINRSGAGWGTKCELLHISKKKSNTFQILITELEYLL